MRRALGRWEILSGPNKDGSTHIGVRVLPDATAQLRAAGYNLVNKMYERSVDREAVATIRIGDVVDVRFDGDKGWWAWRGNVRLGRLTWSLGDFEEKEWREASPRIDDGTLQVIRLVVDAGGAVVNAGGIVRRDGVPIPPLKNAVPDALVTVRTLRARVGAAGDVQVMSEKAPVESRRKNVWSRRRMR
ncbi:hypothetical protein [Microbacterium istanbulense]|uniref:Uncharacterized protein n=1 Tax=Microbacterium istanbulense TaxID=3122049 RepID=A0ABU8LK52_9MICO